nr:rifin PIR protein,putative [Plasmodium sp. DRC-Itaito]
MMNEKSDKDIKDIIVKDKIQEQITKQLSALEKVTDTDNLFKAKIDCNIKNMKQALNKIGYIRPIKFVTLGNKDGKDAVDVDHLFSSIMNSSDALFQKYMEDDVTSNGSIFKKQSGFISFALYAL